MKKVLNYVQPSSQHATKMEHILYFSALVPVTHNSYFYKSENPKGYSQVLPQMNYFHLDKAAKQFWSRAIRSISQKLKEIQGPFITPV